MNIAAMVRHTWTQPCTVTSKHEKCRGASWKEIFPPKAKLPSMASSLQTKRESLHQSKDKGKLPTSRKAGRSLLNYQNPGQANKNYSDSTGCRKFLQKFFHSAEILLCHDQTKAMFMEQDTHPKTMSA